MPDDDRYSLTELADLAGVTPRTVRYYLAQGLLRAVGPSGPGSKYDADHLARLRLIRRLQAEHLPLAEIRRRLERLADDDIRDLSGSAAPVPPADSALDYLRTVLDGSDARFGTSPPRMSAGPALARHHASPAAVIAAVPLAAPADAATSAGPTLSSADPTSGPTTPTSASDGAPTSAPIERSQWERIVLAPDVELHLRRPLARAQQRQVDRLVQIARELLEEDRP